MEDKASRLSQRFDLTDRIAIVTGASSGLGATIARTLASQGAHVVVVARRKARLDELAREIRGTAAVCDLLDDDQLSGLVTLVSSDVGNPEILVNVAGDIFSRDPAQDEPLDAVRRTFELNVIAPFRLCQDVFPYMASLGRGTIVNISSISGVVGVPGVPQASYAASKQALSAPAGRSRRRIGSPLPGR